jgi:hypothetical protein
VSTYDHWKSTNPADEELGSQKQPNSDPTEPNELEAAAIALHDFLWLNLGEPNGEWPLQLTGDDDAVREAIRLLNVLQDAINASGIPHRQYQRKLR